MIERFVVAPWVLFCTIAFGQIDAASPTSTFSPEAHVMYDIVKLIVELGVMAGVAIYLIQSMSKRESKFIDQAKEREERMAKRIDILEEKWDEQLTGLVKESTAATVENTQAIQVLVDCQRQIKTSVDGLTEAFNRRPCAGQEARETLVKELVDLATSKQTAEGT